MVCVAMAVNVVVVVVIAMALVLGGRAPRDTSVHRMTMRMTMMMTMYVRRSISCQLVSLCVDHMSTYVRT